MRIEWREENARAVASMLEQTRIALEESRRRRTEVEDALRRADPEGKNRKLRALRNRFEAAMTRAGEAAEEAERLREGTERMIELFEDSERDVKRLLASLEPGRGREEERGSEAPGYIPAGSRAARVSPIPLPRARIAPVMRMSALGPMAGWLMELIARL